MNDIDNLVIDNNPILKKSKIVTEFSINSGEEISISINNSIILDKSDIIDITDNIIELSKNIEITKEDLVVVIYNKI
jgi:urease accessory protein UreE